jgi:DNA invertase Pin-like site-specific DNA recombinase
VQIDGKSNRLTKRHRAATRHLRRRVIGRGTSGAAARAEPRLSRHPAEALITGSVDATGYPARSLKDVLHIMERIAQAGAGFRSITESIDTTTPAGCMMMQMVGSFAEFERAMIRERTSAGLAAARAEGRVGGRRKKLDAAKRDEIAHCLA